MAVTGGEPTIQLGLDDLLRALKAAGMWIALETKEGNQRKPLPVDGKPQATFALTEGDEVVAAYEYCNLHGLWKAEA